MADYLVDVVDEKDVVIGSAMKRETHQRRLLHRIIHVFVFNDKGEVLLQARREKDGDGDHGRLDASVGGHVDQGESYENAAKREMREELGISSPIRFVQKYSQLHNADFIHYCACFTTRHNGPFTTDPKETLDAKFYTRGDLVKRIKENPAQFTPETVISLKHVLSMD